MKIGIDGRLWNETGVGRYTRNLVNGIDSLAASKKINHEISVFLRKNEFTTLEFKSPNIKKVLADISWHSLSEQIFFTKILRHEKLDLMHFPYFSLPISYKRPYVVTIHDLIINRFPTGKASTLPTPIYWGKWFGYKFILKKGISNAKKIIVPSHAVEAELKDQFGVAGDRVKVIYEGGFEEKDPGEGKNVLGKKYFLKVGNAYPHKNVNTLLNAFSKVYAKDQSVYLVFAAKKDFFYKRILEKITYPLMSNIIFIENPTDKELKNLYKNAIATIVPSFMEGFGLTAIEALSCGCPILLSDIPVHREICKNTASYFDPYDETDMAQKMQNAISVTPAQREKFAKMANAFVKKYSWEKMVSQTLELYESCFSIRQGK